MIENDSLKKINVLMQMTLVEGVMSEEECLDEISQIISYRNKPKKKRSKSWEGLKKMPPLYHKLPDEQFVIENSEVLKWIGQDKPTIDWVMRSASRNGYLEFNKSTGKWSGVNHD